LWSCFSRYAFLIGMRDQGLLTFALPHCQSRFLHSTRRIECRVVILHKRVATNVVERNKRPGPAGYAGSFRITKLRTTRLDSRICRYNWDEPRSRR